MKQQTRTRRGAARTPGRAARLAAPDSAERNIAAVANALGHSVQPKLALGRSDDPLETQADRAAAQVMRGAGAPALTGASPTPADVQRMCASCEEENEQVQRATSAPMSDDAQKEAEEEKKKQRPEDESIQRKSSDAAAHAPDRALPARTAARIDAKRVGGAPLPASERTFFESRFATDLAHVRLHADVESAQLARDMNARAFTVGPDIFFGAGQYRPGSFEGRYLMAHELAHVEQQRGGASERRSGTVRRWEVGAAPAPPGWEVITDAEQLRRLDRAEAIVRGVLGSRRCQTAFRDHCPDGFGDNPLQTIFDSLDVYLIPTDNNLWGETEVGSLQSAFNLRAFRIGPYFMASTLLHEMFHSCDPDALAGHDAELRAETAVERCRLYTPWINAVTPAAGAVGSRVTIHGWNFGPLRGPADAVRIGGVNATIVSWVFLPGSTSAVQIVAEVPAGAAGSGVVVVNNNVQSNTGRFAVT